MNKRWILKKLNSFPLRLLTSLLTLTRKLSLQLSPFSGKLRDCALFWPTGTSWTPLEKKEQQVIDLLIRPQAQQTTGTRDTRIPPGYFQFCLKCVLEKFMFYIQPTEILLLFPQFSHFNFFQNTLYFGLKTILGNLTISFALLKFNFVITFFVKPASLVSTFPLRGTELFSDWLKFTHADAETLRRFLFRVSVMVWGDLKRKILSIL